MGAAQLRGQGLKLTRYFSGESTYGSAEAFSGLYERTHLIVFRYIYALYGEPQEDAEDIWHETFLKAWRTRHRFSGDDDAALGWLLKIAQNTVIDRQRRRRRRPVSYLPDAELFAAPGEDAPEHQVILKEQTQALWKMLETLSSQQRDMLILRYVVGWRVNQIAKHLGMPENTVTVTLRRVLNKLSNQED